MQTFDLLNHPLTGTTLIEANAGTGKTYTITGLFLRLILERNLTADQILVVTFTEAATAELKDRIRKKLHAALERLTTGRNPDPEPDLFLEEYISKIMQPDQAVSRLKEALCDFDRAAIFTIHGFCQRVLHEQAFESGELFDTELITDQEDLKREILADFWRCQFYRASSLFIHYAIQSGFNLDTLAGLANERFIQPYLKIIPRLTLEDTTPQEKTFEQALARVKQAWQQSRNEIEDLLLNNDSLNKTYYKPASIPQWFAALDAFLSLNRRQPFLFKEFKKFTRTSLENAVKKNSQAPMHPFFDLCESLAQSQEELLAVFEERLLGLKWRLLQELRVELAGRKRQKNIQSFDDLLRKVQKALQGQSAGLLLKALRVKFKAALIDEFQDTDPVQYDIFKRIFSRPGSTLFLIGDPKQSIYGFRSADLFTYLTAAEQIPERYTLRENWRSQPGLIRAVNTLFDAKEHPFLYEQIGFQTSFPAEKQRDADGKKGSDGKAALQLWYMDSRKFMENSKPVSKGLARKRIMRAVAAEISRMLQPAGKQPSLNAEDIAVLVRRNSEARQMQNALNELQVPSVLYSSGNLFESSEALEMQQGLNAVVEPGSPRLLKAAMTTDLMGLIGEELESLSADEGRWEDRVIQFKNYHDLWEMQGFTRMAYALFSENKVLSRLITYRDGERRVTNLLHLVEVLQQTLVARKWNMAGLLKWLAEQIAGKGAGAEEQLLRLERDDRSVKLVTIHKSKGLEYPVVFCPFLWDGSRQKNRDEPLIFHDPLSKEMVLDLGSENLEEHQRLAEIEALAENLRLFYVALTRARDKCYLVWGRLKEAETSAPAYLLHGPQSGPQADLIDQLAEKYRKLDDEALRNRLESLVNRGSGDLALADLPGPASLDYAYAKPEQVALNVRTFRSTIERQWRITSFSGLSAAHLEAVEAPDHDALGSSDHAETVASRTEESAESLPGIFAFPKGARAGECIHKIFESLDFTGADERAEKALIAGMLKSYGFDSHWEQVIHTMTQKVLALCLAVEDGSLQLKAVPKTKRLNELEFYFPLQRMTPESLTEIFGRHAQRKLPSDLPEQMGRLNFTPVKGFIRGFMDLVFEHQGRFYLADWKSNHLGDCVEDYHKEAVLNAMSGHFYFLQYHLYAMALHQYLKLRLTGYDYEKQFGGVYYLFVRGMDPEKGREYGVFYDRPRRELIEELCEKLIKRN